jgi:hypothetical protein
MPGKFLHGAFVEFMPTFLIPLPNIIIFQFNPETMTHTWSQAEAAERQAGTLNNPLAVRGMPGETFSFSLAMDASDMIADGSVIAESLARTTGIYTRLAALEMLLYPTGSSGGGLLGSISLSVGTGGIGGAIGGAVGANVDRSIPQSQVPTVLFVWGPGRILPVRVTGLTITEKLYDSLLLNPTHAEAQITLKVLTPEELVYVTGPLGGVANVAYQYSQALRQTLALANLANAAESIIGMLPV